MPFLYTHVCPAVPDPPQLLGLRGVQTANVLNAGWRGTAYNSILNRLVAVAESSRNTITSDDGAAWTSQINAMPVSSTWECVDWGYRSDNFYGANGAFLACSRAGLGARSLDGITWSSLALPFAGDFRKVLWVEAHQRFYVFANSATPNNSGFKYDTAVTNMTTLPALNYFGAAYSPTLGRLVATGVDNVAYSDDEGATWTQVPLPSSFTPRGFAWSDDLAMFVGTGFIPGPIAASIRSTDGVNWTIDSTGLNYSTQLGFVHVVWSHALQRFLAVSQVTNSMNLASSADGATWSQHATAVTQTFNDILWVESYGQAFAPRNAVMMGICTRFSFLRQ